MKKALLVLFACLALPLHAADFTPLDRHAAQRLLDPSSYRQPTVVTLWSSDCSYCKQNLQLLSVLIKRHKNLRVITVATESESAALAPLLARFELPGPRYVYGNDSPEAIAHAIDPTWAGELPRSYLFNGSGGKAKVSGVIGETVLEQTLLLPRTTGKNGYI